MTVTTPVAKTVDARGLSCPLPIVKTALAIKELATGQLIEVLATDPGSTKDFTAWTKSTGNVLVESSVDGAVFRYLLRKK
ncbi:MAG TPA: sulfurtransferase TusA family protein [Candidatus Limnocylindrales bacterium]|nr:sulfurtransferase TusA family protein [Candidatus Limnocylindrales bacterium]